MRRQRSSVALAALTSFFLAALVAPEAGERPAWRIRYRVRPRWGFHISRWRRGRSPEQARTRLRLQDWLRTLRELRHYPHGRLTPLLSGYTG